MTLGRLDFFFFRLSYNIEVCWCMNTVWTLVIKVLPYSSEGHKFKSSQNQSVTVEPLSKLLIPHCSIGTMFYCGSVYQAQICNGRNHYTVHKLNSHCPGQFLPPSGALVDGLFMQSEPSYLESSQISPHHLPVVMKQVHSRIKWLITAQGPSPGHTLACPAEFSVFPT